MIPAEMTADDAVRHVCIVLECGRDRACLEIANLAASGFLRSFGSTMQSKEMVEIPGNAWSDNISSWKDDFIGGDREYYVYHFERKQILAMFPFTGPASSAPEPQAPRRSGGAPLKFNWDELTAEVIRRVHNEGIGISDRQFTDEMLEWCNEKKWDSIPAEPTLRARIGKWLAPLRREMR